MARIDRFIEACFTHGADSFLIASGERALMFTEGNGRPFTPQAATVSQVEGLIQEIAPPDRPAGEDGSSEYEFTYDSPSGAVNVAVSCAPGRAQVEINLKGAPAAAVTARVAARANLPPAPEPPAPTGAPAAGGAGRSAIESLLRRLVSEGGSDLHLCSGNPAFIRKDGEMHAWTDTGPYAAGELGSLLDAITPERYRERFAETGDADFSHEIPGLARFRCNRYNDRLGPGAVMRVIPVEIPSAEKLDVPKAALDLCDLHKGLVLVTGPTGSGKSTTLASMIDRINRTRPAHIITIEDPIEFIHRNQVSVLNQREVGAHTSSFKAALRAALREDPDIVLVGEMRDLETIAIALETAETGHLVFGTLHTNTAPSTVDRIIEVFPTERQNQIRAMLAESLKGVIAQTLLRRKGGGRIAAREVLIVNPAISNLIREGKTFQIPTMMQTGRGLGMVTMNDALVEMVRKGLVDVEEALGKAPSRTEFQASLKRSTAAAAG